jgi:hypothetical protein
MDQRAFSISLLILAGCAGAPTAVVGARVANATPALSPAGRPSEHVHALGERAAVPSKAPPTAPLEYDDAAAAAKIFVANTNHTIALYREFIQRAGSDPQYAAAVRHSREQIQDLSDTLIFVRSGIGEAAPAKPDAP